MSDVEATQSAETTTTDSAPDKGANTSGQQAATFTQADLDRIAGEARKDGRSKAMADLLKELGAEKTDEVKAKLARLTELEQSQMTEVEKAQAAREKAEQAAAELKAQLETERQERRIEARDSRVKDALVAANAKADKVLKLLRADRANELDELLDKEGKFNETKLTALIEKAKADYPEDFGQPGRGPGSPSLQGGRNPEPDQRERERALADLRQRNRSF